MVNKTLVLTSCDSFSCIGHTMYSIRKLLGVACCSIPPPPSAAVWSSPFFCFLVGRCKSSPSSAAAACVAVTATATLTGLRNPARARASTASCHATAQHSIAADVNMKPLRPKRWSKQSYVPICAYTHIASNVTNAALPKQPPPPPACHVTTVHATPPPAL